MKFEVKTSVLKEMVMKSLTNKLNESKKINEDHNDLVEYDIPEWAVSALINGDYSGLEDEDEIKINNFVNGVVSKFGNANFMMDDIDGEDNLGFRRYNDIDNLGSNVYRLYIRPSNVQESKKSTKQRKFDKVMGEFGDGTLKTSAGKKVTDRKQAVAIAYSESGLDEGVVRTKQIKTLVENIVRNVLKEDIYSFGLSDNQFLKSPEYFVETYFNGQFSQLKKLFNNFVETDRLRELTNYIDGLGYSKEIANYLKGRSRFVNNHSFQRWLSDNSEDINEELIGNQTELDVNKNNKLDSEDFKQLRNESDETELIEGRPFQLGKGYTHFAIDKPTGKIINGYDYKGYDDEDLKYDKNYYFINDLADYFDFQEPQRTKKDVKIMPRKALEKSGINIMDSANWLK